MSGLGTYAQTYSQTYSRQWKPGDVAMVTSKLFPEPVRALFDGRFWNVATGGCTRAADTVRPLAVIDPDDREQAGRLLTALNAQRPYPAEEEPDDWRTDRMQAALAEFADLTPPKPPEPTGLGAVVADAQGRSHVRGRSIASPWIGSDGTWRRWDQFSPVRVLSEGVTP